MVGNESADSKRSFSADAPVEERGPALLNVLSTVIALQRYHGFVPSRLRLNTDVYIAVGRHLGVCTVDKLFGVPVEANLDDNAVPFVLEGEYRRRVR